MNGQGNKRGFYQSAMYYGTVLGTIWSIMYILTFIGLNNPLLLLGCIALFVGSPFFAASFTKRYRRNECGNGMKYLQAFTFLYCMYICASLLSTLAMFLYFRFIDDGMFMTTLQEILNSTKELPGMSDTGKLQIEQSLQIIQNTTTSDFVWQTLGNNILNASVLPLIIAIFVRRNNKEQ